MYRYILLNQSSGGTVFFKKKDREKDNIIQITHTKIIGTLKMWSKL